MFTFKHALDVLAMGAFWGGGLLALPLWLTYPEYTITAFLCCLLGGFWLMATTPFSGD